MANPPVKGSLKIIIADDEPLARNRMQKLCERVEQIGPIFLAENGHEAVQIIADHAPDIVMLDIDMPDFSGMEVAEYCKQLPARPEIIFTTAHSKYAVQAFRFDAADYLLKPVKQHLLAEAVARVLSRKKAVRNEDVEAIQYIWVQDGAGSINIRCSDIDRIEAQRDYMRLVLSNKSYLVHEPMQSLQARLPKDMFIRLHRSVMVRRDLICSIRRKGRRTYAVLKDNSEQTIGPVHAGAVMKAISAYSGGSGLSETVTE